MHKKQGSLIPLNYEYSLNSEQDEAGSPERQQFDVIRTSPPSTILSRKIQGRPKTSESQVKNEPCSCTSTAIPSRSGSLTLPHITHPNDTLITPSTFDYHLFTSPSNTTNTNTTTSNTSGTPHDHIAFSVDGHQSTVSFTSDSLEIMYTNRGRCCMPGVRSETIPISEILSAEIITPPTTSKWLWRPFARLTFSFAIYTFKRSASSPTTWYPRRLIFTTPVEKICHQWTAAINAAAASQTARPRNVLVLINPFGGKKQAQHMYDKIVAPVFEKAGIKTVVQRTQYQGHAKSFVIDMSLSDLSSYDGIIAVGGDGLFHEIINGLLIHRTNASIHHSHTTTTPGTSSSLHYYHPNNNAPTTPPPTTTTPTPTTTTTAAQQPDINAQHIIAAKATAAASIRVGHIPAGSTDAVACTLHGTRSAFSAAMRIALGDGIPLDVLRIDAADGTTEFATCMASYGFMGDLMAESEAWRWMGPLRYELIGAKMLAANRSYRARISYLPAEQAHSNSFTRACTSKCDLCLKMSSSSSHNHQGVGKIRRSKSHAITSNSSSSNIGSSGNGSSVIPGSSHVITSNILGVDAKSESAKNENAVNSTLPQTPSVPTTITNNTNNNTIIDTINRRESFPSSSPSLPRESNPRHHASNVATARHSRHSLDHRPSEWITIEDDFTGVMLVIMPCRSDKSLHGVARYGHLSDGNIHLVLVRKCSRFQYLRFLLKMSSTGLEAGLHHGGHIEVIPAVAVRIEPGGDSESLWNIDGELLKCAALTAETHRGAIDVFARGVEQSDYEWSSSSIFE